MAGNNRIAFIGLAALILLISAFLRLEDLHRYPPGPHYDEAANVLITRSIALDGANLFPIANSYQGRESLYFYLAAPIFRTVNADAFGLRLVSVFCNLITLAASMALGRALFGGKRGLWVGLIVGGLMALNFHQIFMSRQAFRAVSLPMMQALGLLFLWRGLTRRPLSALWLILGGAFSAGALYTYMASRLFPLWLGIAALVLLGADRRRWRLRLGQGVIFFGSMALFALPLIAYALNHPDIFFQRLTEVQEGDVTVTLAESVRLHAEMFFLHGDFGNLRYNIPGRPYFTVIEAPFLLIGLWIALRGVFREKNALQRSSYTLIALAPLMVIPSVIALAGSPPSHMRSLGMVPLIFLMVALGVETVIRAVRLSPRWIIAALMLVFAVMAWRVRGEYRAWASRADLFVQSDGDLALATDWLNAQIRDQPIYISSYHRQHPTVIRALQHPVTWLGLDSLILPPSGVEGVVVFSHDFPPPEAWSPYLSSLDGVPSLPDGSPAFWAYAITAPEDDLSTAVIAPNAFVALIDVHTESIVAGESGTVTLVWRIVQDVPFTALRPVLKLTDAQDFMWCTSDPYLLDTDRWRRGETIIQNVRVDVPTATPSGDYALWLTWVDRASGQYLQFLDAEGQAAGIDAVVGTLTVTVPDSAPTVTPQTIVNADIAPGVRLLGWDNSATERRPGEWFTLDLYWQAIPAAARDDFSVTLVIGDRVLASQTLTHPASVWRDGEVNHTRHRWQIPLDLLNNEYTISLKIDENNFALTPLFVRGQARMMKSLVVDHVLNTPFENQIALYGYTLTQTETILMLDLVWYTLREMARDYTVFVHLVDENGVILAQMDAMPQSYNYPTSLWITGEYVPDRFVFENPPADIAAIRIGLYDQASGIRLYISNVSAGIINDNIEIVVKR